MSIEDNFQNLESTVEDLDESVRSNTSATNGLLDAVKELTEYVKANPSVLNVSNSFLGGATAAPPERENWCGFLEGDKVVYVGSVYKSGLNGTVKFHATRAFRDGEVPVIRADNNAEDVFPARSTILASSLEQYDKPEQPWYKGEPTGDRDEWNERILRAAAEEGFHVTFLYEKPRSLAYLSDDEPTPETRRVTISSVTSLPSAYDFGDSVVHAKGFDTGRHAPRNFRLDRIKSFVRYSD